MADPKGLNPEDGNNAGIQKFSIDEADFINTSQDHIASSLLDLAATVDQYYTPFLCLFGALGNCLSIAVFFTRTHKARGSLSSSVYLSALAITDTGFLINLFILWLNNMGIDLLTNWFMCPMVMYLGQVTGFLSVWLIVAFTVERFTVVCYPLSRHKRCTASRARRVTAGLTIFAAIAFSYICVIAKVIQIPAYDVEETTEGTTTLRTDEMTWTNESLSRLSDSEGGTQPNIAEYNISYKLKPTLPLDEGNNEDGKMDHHLFPSDEFLISNIIVMSSLKLTLVKYIKGNVKIQKCQSLNLNLREVNNSKQNEPLYICSVPQEFMKLSEISNYIDSILTFIIPFIVISCLNLKIIFCVKRFKSHREGLLASMKITHTNGGTHNCKTLFNSTDTPKLKDFLTSNGRIREQRSHRINMNESQNACCKCEEIQCSSNNRISGSGSLRKSRDCKAESTKPSMESDYRSQGSSGQITPPFKRILTNSSTTAMEIRVTKTLLLVSSVFLFLHFPSHSIRVASFIQSFGGSLKTQRALFVAQMWSNILFNTNFAVNFLLYCCSGRAFRHSVKNLLSWHPTDSSLVRTNTTTMTTQVNLNNMKVSSALNKKSSHPRNGIFPRPMEPEEELV